MAPRTLETYRKKRDFEETPEPSGAAKQSSKSTSRAAAKPKRRGRRKDPRFVVQEHSATAMHWDLRLEHEGVLLSWAVPKGVPLVPKENRLAVRTEDHPIEYLDFEGEIPEGSYGAGTMSIWDHGTYEPEEVELEDGKVHFRLEGERVHGRYVLVRTKVQRGKENWILRRLDPPEDPDAEPMPEHVKPMLAKLAEIPKDPDQWAFEVKWDGIRAVVFAEGGRIRIETRNLNDVTAQYPELTRLGRALGSHTAVLDGEIVAFDEHGRPSFQTLQSRLGLTSESTIRTRAKSTPVRYVAFDLLFLDGRDLKDLPYEERRAMLRELIDDTPHWQVPDHHVGTGRELLDAVVEQGLEGIMAKRLDSTYKEANRGGAWLKIKQQQRQEFVVCGWTEGEGRRGGSIGALLLAYHDATPAEAKARGDRQKLVYAGSVGTGFSDATLAKLHALLEPLETKTSPLDVGSPDPASPGKWAAIRARERAVAQGLDPRMNPAKKGRIHWAKPKLVCECEYTEFTRDGTLRHPSFKGLRDDKSPKDVVREDVAHDAKAKPTSKPKSKTRPKGSKR
jgi:bifunctional non-homologous end joining protein LigD